MEKAALCLLKPWIMLLHVTGCWVALFLLPGIYELDLKAKNREVKPPTFKRVPIFGKLRDRSLAIPNLQCAGPPVPVYKRRWAELCTHRRGSFAAHRVSALGGQCLDSRWGNYAKQKKVASRWNEGDSKKISHGNWGVPARRGNVIPC